MKMLMLGLMMVFAVASVIAADEISVTRDRVEKKIKNGDRYIFVTNKVDRVGSVKGKIANHYVRISKEKYGGQHLLIFADGSVKTAELNLKEPYLVCYILISSKSTGRKYVRGAKLTAEKKWVAGGYDNPKEYSKKRVEVPAGQWRAYRGITATGPNESSNDYVGLKMDETVICYRMELWQDGRLLDMKDTSKSSVLSKLGLDFDWYVMGKNKEKLADFRLTQEAE